MFSLQNSLAINIPEYMLTVNASTKPICFFLPTWAVIKTKNVNLKFASEDFGQGFSLLPTVVQVAMLNN